jgi:hypothetical protein
MSNTEISEIWIDKANLAQTKMATTSIDTEQLHQDEVLLKTDDFGFSANNITYALFGDKMGYWGFFPAAEGYGKVPIWGFATVIASNHSEIAIGEKVFGYLPLASHLLITAGKVTEHGFYDVAQRRKTISPVYDNYVRCANDPGYDKDKEAWQLNYRPLFMTSFVLDDYVGEQINQQTKSVILTSASSKTAYGAAFLLKHHKQQRAANYQVIGLTSKHNKAFTESSGCYDKVVCYDDIAELDMAGDNWVLDFAGNKELLLDLQKHGADTPAKLIFIGATDVESQTDKPQAKIDGELFFAPAQVKKRIGEWGSQGFGMKYAKAWTHFSKQIENLVRVTEVQGEKSIDDLYKAGLAGKFATNEIIVARF